MGPLEKSFKDLGILYIPYSNWSFHKLQTWKCRAITRSYEDAYKTTHKKVI
jgi:hypothetical protein